MQRSPAWGPLLNPSHVVWAPHEGHEDAGPGWEFGKRTPSLGRGTNCPRPIRGSAAIAGVAMPVVWRKLFPGSLSSFIGVISLVVVVVAVVELENLLQNSDTCGKKKKAEGVSGGGE